MILLGCGMGTTMSGRQLQTITVTPATASAQGQAVQFTATGHWSAAPVSVTPQAANWAACVQQVSGNTVLQSSTTEVTVSSHRYGAVRQRRKGNVHGVCLRSTAGIDRRQLQRDCCVRRRLHDFGDGAAHLPVTDSRA